VSTFPQRLSNPWVMPGRRWLEDANEKETVKRVLVVDDDLTTRNGLAEFLADPASNAPLAAASRRPSRFCARCRRTC
jgi:hypothetical protein